MMNKTKYLILFFCMASLLLISSSDAYTQNNDALKNAFQQYINELKSGKNKPVPDAITRNSDELKVIETAVLFSKDSIPGVRSACYYIIKRVGLNSELLNVRQAGVYHIMNACKDKDSGISGMAGEYLSQFEKEDFSPKSLDSLRSLLRIFPAHYENIVKLAGFLELSDMEAFLSETIYGNAKISRQAKWACHLALARMGVESEISFCLERCMRIAVNDNVVYSLFPDMIYIRQKKIYDYLLTVLNSNEKNCSSPNPDSGEKILCGYRIMEYFAPVIKGFPLKTDISGDIETDNYEAALQQTRDWFQKNPDYLIDITRF